MNSRAVVAIILALTVASMFVLDTPSIKVALGAQDYVPPSDLIAAWENLMFTVIGALAGYITGKDGAT